MSNGCVSDVRGVGRHLPLLRPCLQWLDFCYWGALFPFPDVRVFWVALKKTSWRGVGKLTVVVVFSRMLGQWAILYAGCSHMLGQWNLLLYRSVQGIDPWVRPYAQFACFFRRQPPSERASFWVEVGLPSYTSKVLAALQGRIQTEKKPRCPQRGSAGLTCRIFPHFCCNVNQEYEEISCCLFSLILDLKKHMWLFLNLAKETFSSISRFCRVVRFSFVNDCCTS